MDSLICGGKGAGGYMLWVIRYFSFRKLEGFAFSTNFLLLFLKYIIGIFLERTLKAVLSRKLFKIVFSWLIFFLEKNGMISIVEIKKKETTTKFKSN